MPRTVVYALVAIAACSGATHAPSKRSAATHPAACRHDAPGAGFATLYGTVTDRSGAPLPNVTVVLEHWHDTSGDGAGGVWVRDPDAATTTSGAVGSYKLTAPLGSYRIEARLEGAVAIGMGYRANRATRRLDITLESGASVFDASLPSELECEPSCPRAHAPRDEWWRGAMPCPEGSSLTTEVDAKLGIESIRCVASGVAHGAFTSWQQSHDGWVRTSGWQSHGEECGTWVEPAPVPLQLLEKHPLTVPTEPTSNASTSRPEAS